MTYILSTKNLVKTDSNMNSSTQIVPGSVICLLCRGVVPCTKEKPDKLHQHLMVEHNTFFYKELLFKLHLMDKHLLNAIVDFPITKTKSVAESVKALEKLMSDKQFVEENDSFVSIESTTVKGLAVNDNAYDDIEGSDRYYKDKDVSADYTDLENSHNKSIEDFIKTLPEDISYHSEFDQSTENLEEADYIMERINQMDHSLDENMVPNLEEEEGSKKKFKTQRVTCEVCQKTLSKGSIKNHMRLVHSGVKNVECDACSDKFESKMEVVRHKAREHPAKDRRRARLGRIMSNNSSLDESSRDGTNNSVLDENSRDGINSQILDENSRDGANSRMLDENSFDGVKGRMLDENSPANLLNVTIPTSDTIDEMVDNFAEYGSSN
eukprot:GFUD01023830.1.p1 GENE.GFUD01023830.1~~GFUD01023830.1.p1  ORF type:complete len:381 (-),score=82.71 GFUD01023830.1:23-1165(-)